ncbi:MAG: phosphatase PAP2 family protein [Clostridia bacterium]|nr:phosphatase PAP2 family protein [Clostridia bacterium]
MFEQFEFLILNNIQQIKNPVLDNIFLFITKLGNSGILWITTAILMLFFAKYRKTGVLTLVSLAVVSVVFTLLMKNLVARERPYTYIEGILAFDEMSVGIPSHDTFSFPSGHSVTSFAAATCIFLRHKKLGVICYGVALLISFSRLYMYVHFPSDVICGAIFGILSALVVNFVEGKLSERIRKRVKRNRE